MKHPVVESVDEEVFLLPIPALEAMSEEQRSYLDEFVFIQPANSNYIEAWYADELLAVWDGVAWLSPS